MPEVIIKYEKPETLKILEGLAKYLNFEVGITKRESIKIKGVTIIPGDKNLQPEDLSDIFFDKGLDAKKLRQMAWQHKK